MIMFLQIVVSLAFFVNKVLVLVGRKREGWFVGALAAFVGVFYFYMIGLYIYTALEVGLVILMGYGSLMKTEKNPKVEFAIRSVTVIIMLVLTLWAFSGLLTGVELLSSLGLIVGTYFLTHDKPVAGWVTYAVAHSLAAYLGYGRGQQFFADFQVASAIISIVGATKKV
jgi:hypothetical protein